jgi:hypothetical protein
VSAERSQAEFDAVYDRLMVALPELEARLRARSETFWAQWLADSRTRIEARDAQGLVHLRQAFGGMGSITDLFLQPEDNRLLDEVFVLVNRLGRQGQAEDDAFNWPW